jgi:hypothetical protein
VIFSRVVSGKGPLGVACGLVPLAGEVLLPFCVVIVVDLSGESRASEKCLLFRAALGQSVGVGWLAECERRGDLAVAEGAAKDSVGQAVLTEVRLAQVRRVSEVKSGGYNLYQSHFRPKAVLVSVGAKLWLRSAGQKRRLYLWGHLTTASCRPQGARFYVDRLLAWASWRSVYAYRRAAHAEALDGRD